MLRGTATEYGRLRGGRYLAAMKTWLPVIFAIFAIPSRRIRYCAVHYRVQPSQVPRSYENLGPGYFFPDSVQKAICRISLGRAGSTAGTGADLPRFPYTSRRIRPAAQPRLPATAGTAIPAGKRTIVFGTNKITGSSTRY